MLLLATEGTKQMRR